MDFDIVPSGAVDLEMMRDLGELCDELLAADVSAQGSRAVVPGAKDGGLTVAIAAGGLAVSAISSLVSVLTYWSSRKPRYSLTIQAGRTTLMASGLDKAGVRDLLSGLREEPDERGAIVRVSLK